jgi:hypothetical protein
MRGYAVKRESQFLEELQHRLTENRRLAEKSVLPGFLQGAASYLAFHTFRTLVVASFFVTSVMFMVFYDELMGLSKLIFWYE